MTAEVLDSPNLTPELRARMHALFDAHFAGVTREQFDADLADKNVFIILRSPDGSLAGFSTIRSYAYEFESEPLTVIYSGDTIVAPHAWGSSVLSRTWIDTVRRIRDEHPQRRCFWLLITSGYRTYRFLPVFWQRFYPRYDTPTPAPAERLMCSLAAARFGHAYDAASGIVRFAKPQLLRPALAGIPDALLHDPHVAFFAARNPGHAGGDELVSLCELSDDNLTRAGERMVRGT